MAEQLKSIDIWEKTKLLSQGGKSYSITSTDSFSNHWQLQSIWLMQLALHLSHIYRQLFGRAVCVHHGSSKDRLSRARGANWYVYIVLAHLSVKEHNG